LSIPVVANAGRFRNSENCRMLRKASCGAVYPSQVIILPAAPNGASEAQVMPIFG
jgi:hypothetical protein